MALLLGNIARLLRAGRVLTDTDTVIATLGAAALRSLLQTLDAKPTLLASCVAPL